MLRTLTDIGFREIRITGGEPLLLDNLDAVVEALTLRGLSYTILTNGQQLSHWHDLFVDTPPSKVTISIHSSVSPERVFGVDWDVTEILDEVSRLSNKIEFVASVVVVPSVIDGLTNTIDSLIDAGVGELKLIRPNVATDEGEEVFLSVVEIAQRHARARINIRYSDMKQSSCLLREEGSLSVALPSMKFWACCAKVGDEEFFKPNGLGVEGMFEVMRWAQGQLFRSRSKGGLPCVAHYDACPVSLARVLL